MNVMKEYATDTRIANANVIEGPCTAPWKLESVIDLDTYRLVSSLRAAEKLTINSIIELCRWVGWKLPNDHNNATCYHT